MARPPKGERLDQEEVSAELEIFPQDRERAEQGIRTLNAYEVAAAELEAVGQLQAAARLRLDAQKEQRKLRSLGCDNPAVLQALKRLREEEEAKERKRQRLLHEEAGNRQSLAAARAAVAATDEVLRQKKKALLETEQALQAKRAVKSFSMAELGEGKRACGGNEGRKTRGAVLERLARLGQGISAAQRNDFPYFKEQWDSQMLQEHGDAWPALFASWVQAVVDAHAAGERTAFSAFLHRETLRCLSAAPALVVP